MFLIAGRLSDIFGRRYVILIGELLTVVGGIVGATAKDINTVIAGEVILGAAIGTVSVAYAGISEILPNKYRGIGLAWTEFNLSIWGTTAVLLATTLYSRASWRVIFWICVAYGGISLLGTAAFYFPPAHPRPDGKTRWQEFKELDFIGAFLFTAGLVLLLFGILSGGTAYPWNSAGALAPLIIGFFLLVGSFVSSRTSRSASA
jgi:MFS family permease